MAHVNAASAGDFLSASIVACPSVPVSRTSAAISEIGSGEGAADGVDQGLAGAKEDFWDVLRFGGSDERREARR